jgi:uncharacterized membrane protein YqjE
MTGDAGDTPQRPGLLATLRALPAQLLVLLATRGELAALELAEGRDRLLRALAAGAVAGALLLAALMTVSLWVAAVFWDGPRGLALGLLAAAYLVAGFALVQRVRRELAAAPPLLADTLAELRKDGELLAARAAAPPDTPHGR